MPLKYLKKFHNYQHHPHPLVHHSIKWAIYGVWLFVLASVIKLIIMWGTFVIGLWFGYSLTST